MSQPDIGHTTTDFLHEVKARLRRAILAYRRAHVAHAMSGDVGTSMLWDEVERHIEELELSARGKGYLDGWSSALRMKITPHTWVRPGYAWVHPESLRNRGVAAAAEFGHDWGTCECRGCSDLRAVIREDAR